MSEFIRVIIIDPFRETVTEAQLEAGDYRAIYPLIDCDTFDIARTMGEDWIPAHYSMHWDIKAVEAMRRASIDVYCDDEGLFKLAPLYATMLPTGQPLAGKLMLASSNDEGETVGLPDFMTVEVVARAISFGTMSPV